LRVAAVVGEPLQVGDQDKLLVVVLQRDALAQADVVAEMQLAGGAVAGEDGLRWFIRDSLSDCSAERRPENTKAAFRRL
jgi:hypothetical protein